MFVPDEEPLPDWYSHHADTRHPVGTRDAFVIGEAPRGTTHPIFQDAPRLVVEWDGSAWQPVAVADSFAAACQMIAQDGRPSLFPQAQSPLSPDRSSRWRPGPDRRHGD